MELSENAGNCVELQAPVHVFHVIMGNCVEIIGSAIARKLNPHDWSPTIYIEHNTLLSFYIQFSTNIIIIINDVIM